MSVYFIYNSKIKIYLGGKMKMSKKLLSILLSVVMVVGVFTTLPVASAVEQIVILLKTQKQSM